MVPRQLAAQLRQYLTWFPVVSVTGPRQSGKSTLIREELPDFTYVNLEDPQTRREALEDPVGFIRNRPDHLILDEVQYAPDLFSMIQVVSDERGTTGQYVLSGSQNFLLLKRISQSLAGRVGMLKLLPLSLSESQAAPEPPSADEFMLRGGYPRLYNTPIPTDVYYPNYLSTYIERDVTGLLDVRDHASFRTFLSLCALSAGNLLNLSSLARDAGINVRTAKSWLSMLESSYIVFLLEPYHSNPGKRLIKSPKLYLHDTGLLCHLLGIQTVQQLLVAPQLGQVFENLVVEETLKAHLNNGETPKLFFYRDDGRAEVDMLDFTDADRPRAIEIKSGQTYHDSYARHLARIGDDLGIDPDERYVVSRVEARFRARGANVVPAYDYLTETL